MLSVRPMLALLLATLCSCGGSSRVEPSEDAGVADAPPPKIEGCAEGAIFRLDDGGADISDATHDLVLAWRYDSRIDDTKIPRQLYAARRANGYKPTLVASATLPADPHHVNGESFFFRIDDTAIGSMLVDGGEPSTTHVLEPRHTFAHLKWTNAGLLISQDHGSGGVQSLVRLDPTTGAVTRLREATKPKGYPYATYLDPLGADASRVFYHEPLFNEPEAASFEGSAIWSVPLAGGEPVSHGRLVGDGGAAFTLGYTVEYVDAEWVVFSERNVGEKRTLRVQRLGTRQSRVLDGPSDAHYSVGVKDGTVWFTSDTVLRKARLDGGDPMDVATYPGRLISLVALDGYVLHSDWNGCVYRTPI